jgi:iron complex transport system substrate-binding protein
MKKVVFTSILLSAALFLAACGPAPTPTAEATLPPATQEPAPAWPRTVIDALGREVTFNTAPTRIVIVGSTTTLITDTLFLFPEAYTNIAGISIRGQGADFLPILDASIEAKLNLDKDAGAEQIAALQPDLVIMKSYNSSELGATVEAISIPVFYVYLEAIDSYLDEIQAIGQIFGNEARALEVVDYFQPRIDRVQLATASLTDEQKPSVLVMQHSTKGGTVAFKVPPASWLQTNLVEMAGGNPIWLDIQLTGDDWTVVTLEQVAAWNPDQIYIIDYFDDPAITVEELKNDPITSNLAAVQNGQVFGFAKDTVSWDQPDTRWIMGLTWLATHIQPELFADVNFDEEYLSFYSSLYGLDEARVNTELKVLLQGTIP